MTSVVATRRQHIADIQPGDTVLHNGKEMTVCHKDLTRDPFMGLALFGDTYRLGAKPVIVVEYPRA